MSGRNWEVILRFGAQWKNILLPIGFGETDIFIGTPLLVVAIITIIFFLTVSLFSQFRSYLIRNKIIAAFFPRLILAYFIITIINLLITVAPLEYTNVYRWFYDNIPGFNLSRISARTIVISFFGILCIISVLLQIIFNLTCKLPGGKIIANIFIIMLIAIGLKFYYIHPYWTLDKVNFNNDIFENIDISPYNSSAIFLPLLPVSNHLATKYEWYAHKNKLKIINSSAMTPSAPYKKFASWATPYTVYGSFPLRLAFWMVSNKVDYVILDKKTASKVKRNWQSIDRKFSVNYYLQKVAESDKHIAYTISQEVCNWFSNNVSSSDIITIEPGFDALSHKGKIINDMETQDHSSVVVHNTDGYALYGTFLKIKTNTNYKLSLRLKYNSSGNTIPARSVFIELYDPIQNKRLFSSYVNIINDNKYHFYHFSLILKNNYKKCELRIRLLNKEKLWLDEIIIKKI